MARNFFDEFAREKLGVGLDWQIASWEALDFDPKKVNDPKARMKIVGYVVPRLENGELAWAYKDKSTKRQLTFTHGEIRAWVAAWEVRTGKCSDCHPDHPGQEWIGWNHETGHKFQVCPRCKGTNQAPHLAAQASA